MTALWIYRHPPVLWRSLWCDMWLSLSTLRHCCYFPKWLKTWFSSGVGKHLNILGLEAMFTNCVQNWKLEEIKRIKLFFFWDLSEKGHCQRGWTTQARTHANKKHTKSVEDSGVDFTFRSFPLRLQHWCHFEMTKSLLNIWWTLPLACDKLIHFAINNLLMGVKLSVNNSQICHQWEFIVIIAKWQ